MHNKWAIRCTTRYNKPPMEKSLNRCDATIYQNTKTLLQCSFKGISIENEYTKYHGLIYATKYRSNTYLGTIQPPIKNPSRVFSKTPCTRFESKP